MAGCRTSLYRIFSRLLFIKVLVICCVSCVSKKHNPVSKNCNPPPSTFSVFKALDLDSSQTINKTAILSLEEGGNSLVTRAWLCDQAKKTLDIQYYIFSSDNTGKIAGDYILRAAERGVKVRILVDDITVKPNNKQMRVLNAHENIEIKIYNPGVKFGKNILYRVKKIFLETGKIHKRMHTKTITIDDKVSITGGRNIGDEYFDYDKKYNFRDRDILIFGKEVKSVKDNFELFWNNDLSVPLHDLVRFKKKYNKPKRFEKIHQYACDPKNFSQEMREKIKNYPEHFIAKQKAGELFWLSNAYFVADIPGKNEDRPDKKGGVCTDTIISLLDNAKESVIIQSPYLILDEQAKERFSKLVKRGVKVKILTNSLASTDNVEAFSGYYRDREKILEAGIEVYEFKPNPKVKYKILSPEVQEKINYNAILGIHAKTMIIDNKILVIGSYNLDPRSAHLNTEGIIVARSVEMTKSVLKFVAGEFLNENAWQISNDFNPDKETSLYKRWRVFVRKVIPKKYL